MGVCTGAFGFVNEFGKDSGESGHRIPLLLLVAQPLTTWLAGLWMFMADGHVSLGDAAASSAVITAFGLFFSIPSYCAWGVLVFGVGIPILLAAEFMGCGEEYWRGRASTTKQISKRWGQGGGGLRETPMTETPMKETPMRETPMGETPMMEMEIVVDGEIKVARDRRKLTPAERRAERRKKDQVADQAEDQYEKKFDDNHQHFYWENIKTGVSQWEDPGGDNAAGGNAGLEMNPQSANALV